MTRAFDLLSRLILVFCAVMSVVIFAALSVQIISRYAFNAPIHMTDVIAAGALIWMTFLGAAMVYREHGHIAVEVINTRVTRLIIHVLVIAVLVYVLSQAVQLHALTSRVQFGTLPRSPWTSKFVFVLLPFALGAALTIVFALEAIWRELTGRPPVQVKTQEIV